MTAYTTTSQALLIAKHREVTKNLNSLTLRRAATLDCMTELDAAIMSAYNLQADYATALARLNGVANTFMPMTETDGDCTEPYLPNPFAADLKGTTPVGDLDEFECFLLEGATQKGGKYLDGDCNLIAFEVGDFIAFLKEVAGKKRMKALRNVGCAE